MRYGEHRGAHVGFGLVHIWREHFSPLTDAMQAERGITAFIGSIILRGAAIHYEGGTSLRHSNRSAIFRSSQGLAIVEEKQDGRGDIHYSIITAYRSGRVHGQRVATL